jgi:hypothetical protein
MKCVTPGLGVGAGSCVDLQTASMNVGAWRRTLRTFRRHVLQARRYTAEAWLERESHRLELDQGSFRRDVVEMDRHGHVDPHLFRRRDDVGSNPGAFVELHNR